MSIFDGYFDESGMHEGGTLGVSPVVVTAGFIANTELQIEVRIIGELPEPRRGVMFVES